MLMRLFFIWLFVSERKQTTLMADEKSPARISHRLCATKSLRKEEYMWITVDFDSSEAIYMQLCNQIVEAIAVSKLQEGESLPSVRQMAEYAGINMHTVNKAYALLRQEGYITLDKRRGAVVNLGLDKRKAIESMTKDLRQIIARAKCNGMSAEEIHGIVDGVISEMEDSDRL